MKNLFVLLFLMFSTWLFSQDYQMFETHYLTPKPGHEKALMEEIAEHNRLYHADGPFQNTVYSVMNGSRQGDFFFAMGSFTFTQNDKRPSGDAHAEDWAAVMLHAEDMTGVEYWVLIDELSINMDSKDYADSDMSQVRLFDVTDEELFIKTQKQIITVIKEMGIKRPRIMYRRKFLHLDGPDWGFVSPYKNWAELDVNSGLSFSKTFEKIHGVDSYKTFQKEFKMAVAGREDVWRTLRRDLMGGEDK